jgi:hypothetical protein
MSVREVESVFLETDFSDESFASIPAGLGTLSAIPLA